MKLRPALEVADVFHRHGLEYRQAHPRGGAGGGQEQAVVFDGVPRVEPRSRASRAVSNRPATRGRGVVRRADHNAPRHPRGESSSSRNGPIRLRPASRFDPSQSARHTGPPSGGFVTGRPIQAPTRTKIVCETDALGAVRDAPVHRMPVGDTTRDSRTNSARKSQGRPVRLTWRQLVIVPANLEDRTPRVSAQYRDVTRRAK
jgi:hypothetical protein